MGKLTIKTRVSKNTDKVMQAFTEHSKKAIDKTVDSAIAKAKGLAPVETGALRDSIHAVEVDELNKSFGSDLPYAAAQEFGTATIAPHGFIMAAALEAKRELEQNIR